VSGDGERFADAEDSIFDFQHDARFPRD